MNLVTIIELAEELWLDASTMRKHCVGQGYTIHKMVWENTRRTRIAITAEDAAEVRRHYAYRMPW